MVTGRDSRWLNRQKGVAPVSQLAPNRTTRRLFVTAAAATAAGLLLAGCTAPWISTPTPEPHESFSYTNLSSVDSTTKYHPGDVLKLVWEPQSDGEVHQAQPARITLRAGLYGPFDTVDQLKGQMSSIKTPIHSPDGEMTGAAVQIDPVQTDSWTSDTHTSTLTLPAALVPGFYSLVRSSTTTTERGYFTGEGQTVLQVVAP